MSMTLYQGHKQIKELYVIACMKSTYLMKPLMVCKIEKLQQEISYLYTLETLPIKCIYICVCVCIHMKSLKCVFLKIMRLSSTKLKKFAAF